jgi:hypothetical protein
MEDNLSQEELNDIHHAIQYYRNHFLSITNPRYDEFSIILLKLRNQIKQIKNENIH